MGILITSKRAGFRRAGIEHPDTPTLYDDAKFTKEQLAALESEPMLIVQRVDGEPEGVKTKGKASAKDKDAKPDNA